MAAEILETFPIWRKRRHFALKKRFPECFMLELRMPTSTCDIQQWADYVVHSGSVFSALVLRTLTGPEYDTLRGYVCSDYSTRIWRALIPDGYQQGNLPPENQR